MSRIPIRTRLVLGFALAMALVLAATGIFVYERQSTDLDEQIDRELSARLAGVVAIIVDDGDDLGNPAESPLDRVDEEGFVQVLDEGGEVADGTSNALRSAPILSPTALDRLVRQETSVDARVASIDEHLRIVATRARDDGRPYTPVVGASLEQRDETLSSLSRLLFVGGPVALLLASLVAYAIVSAALRPVESMRAQAALISAGRPGQRLPVPPARDEIANLGETLNEMLARMEVAFERERSFVSDASHELRTPLTVLKAELDLALASSRSADELNAALASASEETNRLVRLADDLLVLARVDEGRLPLQPERIEADVLLGRVSARFAHRAVEAGREVVAEGAPDVGLRADPTRIEQALSNLVENALRYGDGVVVMSANESPGAVELHVRDGGRGLPPELRDRAFERFTRSDGQSATGGSGLGLAIVAAIAAAHGGSAHVSDGNGAGTDAWLRLPASVS